MTKDTIQERMENRGSDYSHHVKLLRQLAGAILRNSHQIHFKWILFCIIQLLRPGGIQASHKHLPGLGDDPVLSDPSAEKLRCMKKAGQEEVKGHLGTHHQDPQPPNGGVRML